MKPTVLDICTGAGGEAIGLEQAGFMNVASIEIDAYACQTLRLNRPCWQVIESDLREVNGPNFRGVDLLAGGVPCPPFTVAGKQLGADDERDFFPEALRLIEETSPKAVLLENVPGFATAKFETYRNALIARLSNMGYEVSWKILNAAAFGVPQLRPPEGLPKLTLRMTARLQAFPDTWTFAGGKTATYRQIGNAFPPPVARAVGETILSALIGKGQEKEQSKIYIFQPILL